MRHFKLLGRPLPLAARIDQGLFLDMLQQVLETVSRVGRAVMPFVKGFF